MSRPVMYWCSWLLMIAGLGWASYLLLTTIEHPADLIPGQWQWLVLATFFLGLSLITNLALFHLFLSMQKPVTLAMSARLHLVGQLLRYLPGRIWGVVYQIGLTRDNLSTPIIVRTNLDMMMFLLIGNTVVAITLIGYRSGWPVLLSAGIVLTGFSIVGFVFLGGANRLLRLTASILPGQISRLLQALAETKADPIRLLVVSGWFAAGWLLYLIAWQMIAQAYPIYAEVDFVNLCALYTLASIIGIVSAITPAGLGVREAAFVILAGARAQTDVIGFIAVFGRVWLLTVEIFLMLGAFGMFLMMGKKQ